MPRQLQRLVRWRYGSEPRRSRKRVGSEQPFDQATNSHAVSRCRKTKSLAERARSQSPATIAALRTFANRCANITQPVADSSNGEATVRRRPPRCKLRGRTSSPLPMTEPHFEDSELHRTHGSVRSRGGRHLDLTYQSRDCQRKQPRGVRDRWNRPPEDRTNIRTRVEGIADRFALMRKIAEPSRVRGIIVGS